MLAIDPKTLRQWVAQAQMSLHTHPTDARVKCLTVEQVHLLASLHGRVVQLPPVFLDSQSANLAHAESRLLSTAQSDTEDLRERLVQVEGQVVTLQAQVSQLALQLLQERSERTEHRLLALEARLISTEQDPVAPPVGEAIRTPCQPERPPFACHSSEKRARVIPLIEYGAKGHYVLICPKAGVLPIAPHSGEWFAWLASLSSFRFVGQSGRFTAARGSNRHGPNRSWYAKRGIHQKNYTKYIGLSEHITLERLEHVAAQFQLYLN